MAITRRLDSVSISFKADGTPMIAVQAVITDDAEGTQSGAEKRLNQAAIVDLATQLRDAILQAAANAGKPLTV